MGFWKKILGQEQIKSVQNKYLSAYEADRMLRRTKELADIANKTIDRDEFYQSISEIKTILKELSQHGGRFSFIGSPSADLKKLERSEHEQIELLEKRIEEKNKLTKEEIQITPIEEIKPIVYQNISIDGMDDLFAETARFIINKDKASIGMLQRAFRIGFNRAARIMDQLCDAGVVGPEDGTKPRMILMSMDQFEQLLERIIEGNTTNDTQGKSENIEKVPIDAECFFKNRLNIDIDYSNDGEILNKIKNVIIPSASNENQIEVINTLLKYNSPETVKLILIDDSIINYSVYNDVPQLLIPVVTDRKKIDAVVNWCSSELEDRIKSFVEYGVKNIESFNEKRVEKGENLYQRIICIVNEAKEFFDGTSNPSERLFMNSNMVGIYFILFSRYSLKSLSLGIIGELLEVCTSNELRLLLQGENTNKKQSTSRNFDDMKGHQFEHFCADVLRKNGFEKVEVTQGSSDQGIDIIAFKDGIKYGIQCKCYSSDIGNKAVQEAFSGKTFYNCHVGAVLTNRYFTTSAKELAEKNGVLLWDRDKLNEMIENK